MSYSVVEAAKAVGKSRATVLRAIQAGRISATRDHTGAFRVEPVELHRMFPPLPHAPAHDEADEATRRSDAQAEARERLARAEAERDLLRELVADLRQQRDRVQEQLTAALRIADQRANGPAEKPTMVGPAPASAWRRFLLWRK